MVTGKASMVHWALTWLLPALVGCTASSVDSEASGCVDDSAEPNDTSDRAAPLALETRLAASACPNDDDFYRFESPVAIGGVFRVRVDSLGDTSSLDPSVTSLTTGLAFWSESPLGVARHEIAVVSDGGAYFVALHVVSGLAGQGLLAQPYALSVSALQEATNDCCAVSAGPGCADPATLRCLCPEDNACCNVEYDALCVSESIGSCGIRCGSGRPESDCCVPSATAGCLQREAEECVCGIDPYCCVGGFDDNCVRLARNQCRLECSGTPTDGP
jgi:hypothetical protein